MVSDEAPDELAAALDAAAAALDTLHRDALHAALARLFDVAAQLAARVSELEADAHAHAPGDTDA